MTPLRGAMIGTGSIASHHLLAWRATPGVEIVVLANRTVARAKSLAREFGVPRVYGDYRELLDREDIDFVDVATAPHLHAEAVLAAAAKGCHVLCQKPFATSLVEARAMIDACTANGVRCVVNENWRWRPWYREVQRLVATGVVGTPRHASFTYCGDDVLPRPDGTRPALLERQPYAAEMPHLLLFEWGIHLIDVLRFLLGDVRAVTARMGRRSPLVRGEDWAIVTLNFGGATAELDLSWSTPTPPERRLPRGCVDPFRLTGDRGTIQLDPYLHDALMVTQPDGHGERIQARAGRTRAEAYQDSYAAMQGHFIACLRSGVPAETEASDNLKTLAATFAAYESAERNATVEVTP